MEIIKGQKGVSGKQVAKYLLLPGVWPRIQELVGSGFVHISFFLAQIYAAVGLLPPTHPYLNPENRGRYGIRHVVAEAAQRLSWKRENIDQIIIFGLMLIGLAILLLQFFFLAATLFLGIAQAAPALPTNFAGFFLTPDHGTPGGSIDLAFVLLDRVFGVENIFLTATGAETCVAAGSPCFNHPDLAGVDPYGNPIIPSAEGAFPWPFHHALHTMFEIYSVGLLIIALLIFLYFVVTVTIETAQSGTPFGRRFNHVWAPIRMVVALGLLIPVANGLNAGQYITLYAAKFGSGFATNGWNTYFLDTIDPNYHANPTNTLLGNKAQLVAEPNIPPFNTLLEFALIVRTCMKGYEILKDDTRPGEGRWVHGWLVSGDKRLNAEPISFADAHQFYEWKDMILVRFGEVATYPSGEPKYKTQPGHVGPTCGDLLFLVPDVNQPGSKDIVDEYWRQMVVHLFLAEMPGTIGTQLDDYAAEIARCYISKAPGFTWSGPCNRAALPDAADLKALADRWRDDVYDIVQKGVITQRANANMGMDIKPLGWGGAALWYNKVAELNGALISTSQSLPVGMSFPKVMEEALTQRLKEDNDITSRDVFRRYRSDNMETQLSNVGEGAILNGLVHAYETWTDVYEPPSGSIFFDAIKSLLGIDGLYNIRDNPDIHPLAQLVTIGRTLVESSIRNFGFSFFSGVGGGLIQIMSPHSLGGTALAASDFLWSIATLGLGIGFVLFYIIPFLPFIYFFFAVGGWVKSIFEAMVGVPLWALAHIRIDGNGLMGDAASSGYFLILEIFLRPILIVFGLIASIQIFSAQVYILHDIWPLVTSSVGGFDETNAGATDELGGFDFKRDYIDEFFYTVIYTIVVYMLGLASFKLINLIPNQILRWLGASVPTFQEQAGDPAQNLIRNTYLGTNILQSGVDQGRQGAMQAVKQRAAMNQAGG